MTKNKKKKHLNFYYKCMETGKLPGGQGLCREAIFGMISESLLGLIDPTNLGHNNDTVSYYFSFNDDIYRGTNRAFWGSGYRTSGRGQFTPLRQTIVLLMAAMNNEL